MYQKIITFTVSSLLLATVMPAVVSANIGNIERKQILSQQSKTSSKTNKMTNKSQSQAVKMQRSSASKTLLEQLRVNSRQQAAEASFRLSIIAADRRDLPTALKLIEEAVQLSKLNQKYLTLASDMSFITQKYDKAEEYQLTLLQIVESKQNPDALKIAVAQDQLAAIYFAQERYENTKSSLQQSLHLREKVLGQSHLLVVVSLKKLAALAVRQQHTDVAELLLTRALKIVRKVSGNRHADSAAMLANLADLYQSDKRLEEAELLYKEALSIWDESPGNPLRQATGQNSFGKLLLRQRRYNDARAQFSNALVLLKQNYSQNHPYVQQAIKNLTVVDAKRGTM